MREIVRQRLAGFDRSAGRVLAHAALLGPRFDRELVARATGLDPVTVLLVLERARTAGLLVEDDLQGGRFAFRHALVRDALLLPLAKPTTRRMHRAIVRALEALPDIDAHVDDLAYHAHEGGLAVEALTYGERAGDGALAARALAEAVRYYGVALAAAEGPASARRLRWKLDAVGRLQAATPAGARDAEPRVDAS